MHGAETSRALALRMTGILTIDYSSVWWLQRAPSVRASLVLDCGTRAMVLPMTGNRTTSTLTQAATVLLPGFCLCTASLSGLAALPMFGPDRGETANSSH